MKKYRFSQSNLVSVTNVAKDDVAIQALNAIKHILETKLVIHLSSHNCLNLLIALVVKYYTQHKVRLQFFIQDSNAYGR